MSRVHMNLCKPFVKIGLSQILQGMEVAHRLVVVMEEDHPLLAQSLLQQGQLLIDVPILSLAVCL